MKYPKLNEPGFFYILNINGFTKFGITQNFKNRMKSYALEYEKSQRPFNAAIHYVEEYEKFWQLEFVETMLRRKLNPWVSSGYETIRHDIPTQKVIDCYKRLKSFLVEYNSFEHIKEYYPIGRLRFKLYKLYFIEIQKKLDAIEFI
ncbi:hypothetical protein N7E81_01605 [Reichenbachiella carrageenanivorans]|uniref:Meiotically up-regulated gene 113 n=1 Tax=Reichenbachiella carrageenanivorans TaxID=2979869 RepID=A0ABY6D0V3_9BACT|nr:hypothetical protein [Reichenbachiella carrageenanivorans]UXX79801.1 hypothetical protein N7E81_01605 [Reichenbachiella carrageenanivorans]